MHLKSCLLLLFLSLTLHVQVGAQTVRLQFEDEPLESALTAFSEETGIDVVYSPLLTKGLTTSCRYRGTSAMDALICIMSGHQFRAQPIGRRQFVLIPLGEDVLPEASADRSVLNGFVLDAETGESLIGAHVILPGLGVGTITNEAGFFALPGAPRRAINAAITYLGYTRLDTTVVAREEPGQFFLHPATYTVDGVIIEESSDRRADVTITPGLLAISSRELQRLPGTLGNSDVLESLRWMPGIQRTGEATGGLLIRGSGPDQNLYLIDGAPVYHPWHAFSLISTFQTDTFKDIALYRGAFPAEFGGRLSAVLDAELRDGSLSQPSATVGISGLNVSFIMESPISNKSSFMLSGRRSYIDRIIGRKHAVEDDFGRQDTLRTGYYFYDWSAKFTFRPDARTSVSVSYYTGKDALDLRLPFDLSLDFSSWLRPADLFFEVDQQWGNRILSIRYQRLISSRLFLTGTLFSSEYNAYENTYVRPSQSSAVESAYDVDLQDVGARVVLDWYPSPSHQVRTGIEAVHHRFGSDLDAIITYSPTLNEPLKQRSRSEATEISAFIQDIWTPRSALRVLPGIRVSWFDNGRYLRLTPRLSAQWVIDPAWLIVRAAASSHVQFMQRIRDRNSYLYDLVSSRWIPSSPTTGPARSGQLSIGVESHIIPKSVFRLDAFAREGRGTLLPEDEFQSKSGLLGPGIEVATLLGQYDRGEERSYGLETGLQSSLGQWAFLFSLTRMRSENRIVADQPASFRPARFDIPWGSGLVVSRISKQWHVGFSIDWRSGYPVSVPDSRYSLTDPITSETTWFYHRPTLNNGRLPPYFRLDIRANRRFRMANADWSGGVSVYNLLNRRNVTSQVWDPGLDSARPKNRVGLPILPMLELIMTL
ncbi:MAG: TonB-dependent receptor plug domain-containing protein [Bacteroidetes bacterium]|nr:TonB-dependent receptor plug domain-containing protein [Bacteroidota bacterium]